jgi:hypothetical protein
LKEKNITFQWRNILPNDQDYGYHSSHEKTIDKCTLNGNLQNACPVVIKSVRKKKD